MSQSALILVDCENDFLSEQGIMHAAVKDSLAANNVIPNLNRVLDAAHANGIPVIFTSISFQTGHPEIGDNAYGILAAVKDANAFVRGSWGADIYDGLHRSDNDHVLQKSTMCAFKQTGLKALLEQQGITQLIFGGLVTDLCLETSMRSAYDEGYEVIGLVDCMASLNLSVHEATVADNFPMFSKPMLHDAFIAQLGQQAA